MSLHFDSPCEFAVHCEGFSPPDLGGESNFFARIAWQDETAEAAGRLWITEQPRPMIERAAVALAALLFARLIPDSMMRVTEQGERADYWLPRLRRALEISGTTRTGELARRHREKAAQVRANPRAWDGYVFVTCISRRNPTIRWSYLAREVKEDVSS
jgi:hypothetical protein